MKLRREQIDALDEARHPEFGHAMAAHLAVFTPLHSENLGRDGIRELVEAAVGRAGRYDLTRRGPVRFFIEATVLLGIDFATDPQYPWAAEILGDPTLGDEHERADQAWVHLSHFLDAAGGPDRVHAKEALRRARELPLEARPHGAHDFEDEVVRMLSRIHPEKVDALGRAPVRGLIARARQEAARYDIQTDEGVGLLLGLMFAVGHGCAEDPKYPWIRSTLQNPAIADRERRVERLYSKTMTYLDHVLERVGD